MYASLDQLAYVSAVASVLALVVSLLVAWKVFSTRAVDTAGLARGIAGVEGSQERIERSMREELKGAREEGSHSGRQLREEVVKLIGGLGDAVTGRVGELARQQADQFESFSQRLGHASAEGERRAREQHDALVGSLKDLREQVTRMLEGMRTDAASRSNELREHVGGSLERFGEASRDQSKMLFEIQGKQHDGFVERLTGMSEANDRRGEALRLAVETQLTGIRQENGEKLELMRATVDEKLQGTLEQRLGDSFKLVSERLDTVHRGLGEMQVLATGVGDLKRVLSNVKARGGWGEVQLGAILEHMLTPSQYVMNAVTSDGGNERVEYAICLPNGPDGGDLLLPVDSKFPIEDYERIQAAAEVGDAVGLDAACKALEARVRASAKDICTKYVNPPRTTDFAIMFLPTEGLYAEVLKRPGLCDDLQRTHRVTIVGPTTLSAFMSSLQMGFKTLAIQQRSSEVWQVLGAVKAEFGKFGPALDRVKKKLQQATGEIERAEVRDRAIQRKLRQVQELPQAEATALLGLASDPAGVEDAEEEQEQPEILVALS